MGERSHLLSREVNLETHIQDVLNLIKWEELTDVILCGHSLGGCVVTGVADRIPDRIRSLVYLDAFVPDDGENQLQHLPQALAERILDGANSIGEGWKVPPIPESGRDRSAGSSSRARASRGLERGIKGRNGFMTDEVIDDDTNMHLVPPKLADIAVLTEPLTIAEKGLIELDSVLTRMPWIDPAKAESRGMNAVVLGAGPVGLLGALALLVRGFDTWVYSREAATSGRADWVKRVGGRYICSADLKVGDSSKQVGNVDLIYEATGAATLAFAALPAIGSDGIFIFTGVPGHKAPVALDGEAVMRNLVLKNQLLYGTVNAGPPAFDAAIADLAKFEARWPGRSASSSPAASRPKRSPTCSAASPARSRA